MTTQPNVFGEPIATCCTEPMTGFYRTGCCETGGDDQGVHTVCAIMTDAPQVNLHATHLHTLEFVELSDLQKFAL